MRTFCYTRVYIFTVRSLGGSTPFLGRLLLTIVNFVLKLGMEPFEVVRDMLRDNKKSDSIGGPPQIVKVYQYMRSAPLAVYWPNKSIRMPSLINHLVQAMN